MNLIELWTKLKERKPEAIIALAVALTTPLFLIVWREWLYEIMAQRVESVPPKILGALIGLLAIWLLASLSFALLFHFRLSQTKKRFYRFGLYWDKLHTPYCPACSKAVVYLRETYTWGFKCVECSGRFIPLNDDNGHAIQIAEAKILLSGKQIEEPTLDDTDMSILTLFTEPDSVVTLGQVTAALNGKAQHAKHRLSELANRGYVHASTVWTSADAPYHLTDKGRAYLITRNVI